VQYSFLVEMGQSTKDISGEFPDGNFVNFPEILLGVSNELV